ncbi:hypothetical protein GLOIN_2v1882637 [Rhizophagus irregularis DAOM 181602=DAOM 197198]|uniref:F-box domain-containing protein n=1 Tax=Rhizophagus irregularis (strain DAOM 181602 / DAOM 197198 / MUCL 43194) TaxID=747089 RepID=A0A2P4PBJ6_RHIID|nr:hypothetical protein GLOIN_2v1882637 [Rhizophagus irregularis DAOM 181602=DAOM 197198]POG62764.1 hypothetical protein GLOIN_2v1882637 [Rhizophagus irregularis DAOM 181602=DAOM 197198]|eukprot:XP_025169630.1 hypothetical protein GLOIN_2v1882637 [Rhizophagus irregularis DAOM 181602=DAOM 197198]
MACSKLFLGDLPELISKVIQYFRYNHKTLHSCILVNRLWCRLAIPLLWEDPFSIKDPKNYHFIKIYLHYLNDDDKTKLNEYVIHNELFPTNTLFNYPSFIQRLNTYKVCYSVQKWIATVKTSTTSNERYFVRNTNLTFIQILNFTKLIYKSLFLIFIENKVNLHSFEVTLPKDIDIDWFDEIFELILQNPNFIYNIKNFEINLYIITADNITKFLRVVYSNCYSISSLYIIVPKYYDISTYSIIEKSLSQLINSQENLQKISFGFNKFPLYHSLLSLKNRYYDISTYSIIEKSLSQLINSQENLQKISFGFNKFPLYHSLLSLKSHNCSNTLNTIIFYYVNFKDIIVLNEVFNQLNVLESIHIVCCYSLDYNFIQQISNVIRPFKLKSLFLHETLQIESLKLLIQKSGNYLENFGISFGITDNESQQLLPLIIKYSSKIKYLETTWLDNESVYLLFSLIENITQNLSYLIINYIDFNYFDRHNISSIILQNLGQILPLKLEYLNLILSVNTSDLKIFLENFQNTFIKKFLIRNTKNDESQDILPYIKEYIVKKKRVKYLAISKTFYGENEDLFFQKDVVKEFQLHDIQVLNYDDLLIDFYNFIKEVD